MYFDRHLSPEHKAFPSPGQGPSCPFAASPPCTLASGGVTCLVQLRVQWVLPRVRHKAHPTARTVLAAGSAPQRGDLATPLWRGCQWFVSFCHWPVAPPCAYGTTCWSTQACRWPGGWSLACPAVAEEAAGNFTGGFLRGRVWLILSGKY